MRARKVCALTVACLWLAVGSAWGQGTCSQNYALSFDGVDDFVVVPHSPTLNVDPLDEFTVELWFRTAAVIPTGVLDSLLEKWNGTCTTPYPYTLRLRPLGQIQGVTYDAVNCSTGSGNIVSPVGSLSDGLWHHIAYERDASQISRLWIDGKLSGTSQFPPFSPTSNTIPLYVGRRGPGGPFANFYQGDIDEIRISSVSRYGSAFTPVIRHASDASTVLLLHFDEGSGFTSSDASPVANNAVLGGSIGASIADPVWVASSLPPQIVGLASSVNGGAFDSSFKTFWAGQVIQVGIVGGCFPSQAGAPYTLMLNFGPEALINGFTPPLGSSFFTTINGLNILSPFSSPTGTPILLGDGLGLNTVNFGLNVGFPSPSIGGTPVTFAFPGGLIPAGFDLRFQAVYVVPTAPGILFGVTNQLLMQAQPPAP